MSSHLCLPFEYVYLLFVLMEAEEKLKLTIVGTWKWIPLYIAHLIIYTCICTISVYVATDSLIQTQPCSLIMQSSHTSLFNRSVLQTHLVMFRTWHVKNARNQKEACLIFLWQRLNASREAC